MLKRLAIISCCALCGFGLGRWLSAPADGNSAPRTTVLNGEAPVAVPATLPQPADAAQVSFAELYRSLRSSSREDRAAYLESLQNLPSGPTRRAALIAFFQCMASISPRAAADLVLQVEGKDDIQRAAIAVLAATAAPQTPLLVQMLLDLPAEVGDDWRAEQLRGQMFFWAAFDPLAAAQFADQHEETYPWLTTGGIIGRLAAADPEAAARWLEEHPRLQQDQEVRADYVAGLYERDPAEARRYVTEHATDEAVQSGLQAIARRTFLASADDAAGFIKQLPTADARRIALEGILNLNTDVFVSEQTSSSSLHAGIAEWVTSFPQEEWPVGMSGFLQRWQELDPNGSVDWIAQLPPATRSAVAVGLVENMLPDRFKQILAAASGEFRNEILAGYARRLPTSPTHRQGFIDALGVSAADAAQLAAFAP